MSKKRSAKEKEFEQEYQPAEIPPEAAQPVAPEVKQALEKPAKQLEQAPKIRGLRTNSAIAIGGATATWFESGKYTLTMRPPHFVEVTALKGAKVIIPMSNVSFLLVE